MDESLDHLLGFMRDHGPFDGLLGFSQVCHASQPRTKPAPIPPGRRDIPVGNALRE